MINIQNILRRELMQALYQDKNIAVKSLLLHRTNVNLPYNHSGWTPFMWVCKEHCDTEIIQLFLDHGGNVHSKNKSGETPLHIMAAHRSNYDNLELLVEVGANVDAQDNDGWTPLMKAVCHPQAMMRKELILNLAENTNTALKNIVNPGQNNDGNVWLYEFIYNGEDKDPELGYITDDDEYEAVAEAFDLFLDDVDDFDEIIELPEEGLDG